MKHFFVFILFTAFPTVILAQDLTITFSGRGEASVVDCVIATNMTTDESITVPGSEFLLLAASTGIEDSFLNNRISIYPNPFQGKASIVISKAKHGIETISVCDLEGREIIRKTLNLNQGNHSFDLTLKNSGIYLVRIEGVDNQFNKIICLNSIGTNSISYLGFNSLEKEIKTTQQSQFKLSYAPGDWIHYRGKSSKFSTVITESAQVSRNIEFEFVDCTDSDGRTYSTVRIGDQFWMEENLGYLPEVSHPASSSSQQKIYYVYDYYGTSLDAAKQDSNYTKYGVLYNWPAAMNRASSSNNVPSNIQGACPNGWHLPSDAEWEILTDYLSNNNYGYGGSGNDIGKSLASNSDWVSSSVMGDVGNNQRSNNISGFNALPEGDRGYSDFTDPGLWSTFWTSTRYAYNDEVWIRGLYKGGSGVIHSHDFHKPSAGYPVRCVKDE